MPSTNPTPTSVLESLTKSRLQQVARHFDVALNTSLSKERQLEVLRGQPLRLRDVVERLGRDELRASCRAHGLADNGKARTELADRLLAAAKEPTGRRVTDPRDIYRLPKEGDIVVARHRQYLVEQVLPATSNEDMSRVRMVCIDDDAQGRQVELLWDLELGTRISTVDAAPVGSIPRMDPPRHFAAYLHALKWSCVSATEADLFQSPFRAGILSQPHQLVPLRKALALPRVNLFIADDVGIGKTIEAGLVAQELLLRQWVDFTLIVCPPAVAPQWREEMERRFGLHFEIYDRAFVGRRRQERGFGVNPWDTHPRFIITFQMLRRPEHRDPLLARLGARAHRSLLIIDEAHTAAPATGALYAVDSGITRVIRDIAPRFENRLFLSATPHNGHSNSFSSLLEILDPQRFTRGVVPSTDQLHAVMVRRLKPDLRARGHDFPERKVMQVTLEHDGRGWKGRWGDGAQEQLSEATPVELQLSDLLTEYSALMCPEKGRGRLVFVNLQKRLLSSVDAFYRTLRVHADALERHAPAGAAPHPGDKDFFVDEEDLDDDAREELAADEVHRDSRVLTGPPPKAKALLDRMLALADAHRDMPDAKVLALLEWIRRHQCPAVGASDGGRIKASRKWSSTRLLIFTEYAHTKSYLRRVLQAALEGTDLAEDRVLELGGGMSDEHRAQVQEAFNAPPDRSPARILLATDAAREGINLQAHCADLLHFDIPWNPARMEQRNGRIDRTLQPSRQIRCAYFHYPQRREDRVLRRLVEKVGVIQKELGSLGAVVMEQLASAVEKGLDEGAVERLERAGASTQAQKAVRAELEVERATSQRLAVELDDVAEVFERSRQVMEFRPELLRAAVDVGCELAGAGPLTETEAMDGDGKVRAYAVPRLPASWARTLDSLRPPREKDESFWDWQQRPLLPLVFEPPRTLSRNAVHLHLQHPFVQRILSRFLAQGFSAHDLSRVTVIRSRSDARARVVVFGRLSLFGPGAVRLHDELVSTAALWLESRGAGHLRPFADKADRKSLAQLEDVLADIRGGRSVAVAKAVEKKLLESAQGDFGKLWEHVEAEAEQRGHEATEKLEARGAAEADALRRILRDQRGAIQAELKRREQGELPFGDCHLEELTQYLADRKHMAARLKDIERELETEPAQLIERYRVVLRRVQPVGMIYLWPEGR